MDLLFGADDDQYDAGGDDLNDLANNPEAAMAYSKQLVAQQAEHQQHVVAPASHPSTKSAEPVPLDINRSKRRDPDVLFDADDVSDEPDGDDDGWGDFEDQESSAQAQVNSKGATQPSLPALDLLGTGHSIPNPRAIAEVDTPQRSTTVPLPQHHNIDAHVTAHHNPQEDDMWDDFEDTVPAISGKPASTGVPSITSPTIASTVKSSTVSAESSLPLTNVPPPAVLLSVFPLLFASAEDALLRPISRLDAKQRQILLAHPATQKLLRSYLTNAIVLGRIIAGRKSRWKRDQFLSQSMRIGPAAAGKKGGMKLTGVDKSEVAKEDREVLDTLRLWKAQVGKLRSAAAAVTSSSGSVKLPAVPDVAEQMTVKTLKPTEGGITSAHACALCGLKREERVAKVDADVNDSFGEWWVQSMNMHLTCCIFWEEQKGKLKSR